MDEARRDRNRAHHGCDHVFFIGFLGAVKTTVARNLGNMFHRSFVDVDHMVERDLHASVARIFETRGEQAFRVAETRSLESLRRRRSLLVRCGGGARELYAHRRPLYEAACDYRVIISGKTFEQVAYDVGELLWERGLL